jgi:hypothetical protein
MCKVLGSIPSVANRKKGKKWKEGRKERKKTVREKIFFPLKVTKKLGT